MPGVGHHTAVPLHPGLAGHDMLGHPLPSVVPPLVRHGLLATLNSISGGEFPDIPQFDTLVFAVGDEMPPVLSGVNVCDSINMS